MINEIYIRTEDDPYFEPGVIEYSNEIEEVMSQIRIILGTRNGQVLGQYNLGVDIDYMVFNTRASAKEIEKKIDEQISAYVTHTENVSVSTQVSFGDSGNGYDYAVIDIYINGQKAIGFLVNKD